MIMSYSSDNNENRHGSLIVYAFSLLSAKISEGAERSAICRALDTPGSVDRALGSGLFAGMVNKTDVYGRVLRPAKSFFSRLLERSAAINALRKAIDLLLRKPLHTFGFFLFFLGLLGGGVTVFEKLGFLSVASGAADLMLCALMVVFSLPLILSRRKLASVFEGSSFFRAIFQGRLGFEMQKLRRGDRGSSDIFLVLLLDIILAAISVFVPMTRIILFLAWLCAFLFLICNPEAGMLLCAVLIPLVDSGTLGALMLVTATGYLIKVLMGKRTIKLSAIDIFVILYFVYRAILLMLGSGGSEQVFAIISYFTARNLLRSSDLHSRYISCISLGISVAAAIELIRYLLSLPFFSGRIIFDIPPTYSPDALGIYFACAIPLTLTCMLGNSDKRDRVYGFVSFALSIACLVLIFDSSIWVYAAAFTALFILVAFRRRLTVLIASAFALPLIYTLGEIFSKHTLQKGSAFEAITVESGLAGALGFAAILVILTLSIPSSLRISRQSSLRYSMCGYATVAFVLPVAALFVSPSGLLGVQMLFWMTLGTFVSCEKMLERTAIDDENQ